MHQHRQLTIFCYLKSALTDIVVEKPDLAFVPTRPRIVIAVAVHIGRKLFLEETPIELLIGSPVLHAVRNITGLNDAKEPD